ncbi:MAG: GNAT family protein [Chloroflexota bacterium]
MIRKEVRLTDGRVLLRHFRSDDATTVYEAVRESVAELSPWMPWCHPDYTPEESKAWVVTRRVAQARGEDYEFAIVSARDGFFLGGCGLSRLEAANKTTSLGYWVRTSRTKQGIATAAALLLVKFGFEELALNRIEIMVDVANKASQRVAEKLGAVKEGILRKRHIVHDEARDVFLYSIVRGDFPT